MLNPPVPFALKVLRGNPGKRPMKPEPQPEQAMDVPEPPALITGYAADEWWRTAPGAHRRLSRLAVAQTLATSSVVVPGAVDYSS
jgi:hypothetical protein